jgi:hypothetical protein
MPLRSNAAWFGSQETRTDLEHQIKVNLMLYDRVIFQNGRWQMTAGVEGLGMESIWWDKQIPHDRNRISYYSSGHPYSIHMGDKCILQGIPETACEVDFYPIISGTGLFEAGCYTWLNGEVPLSADGDNDIAAVARTIIQECEDILPTHDYVRTSLVRGLLRDALTAQRLRLPVCVDFRMAPIILRQQKSSALQNSPELRHKLYDRLIRLNIPDFGEWPWDKVLEARESAAGVAFRQMIARVCAGVSAAIQDGANDADISDLIGIGFEGELIQEVQKRRATVGFTALGLISNAIPFGALISGAKDLLALAQEGESWFGIVGGNRR